MSRQPSGPSCTTIFIWTCIVLGAGYLGAIIGRQACYYAGWEWPFPS